MLDSNDPFEYLEGNGIKTVYDYGFELLNDDANTVVVYYTAVDTDPALLTINVDYTVNVGAKQITLINAIVPEDDEFISMFRSTQETQEWDHTGAPTMPLATFENSLDKLTALTQELSVNSDRSIKILPGIYSGDGVGYITGGVEGDAVVIDADGNLYGYDLDITAFGEAVAEAEASAAAALVSETAAAISAAAALASETAAAISAAAALVSETNAAIRAGEAFASKNAAAVSAGEASISAAAALVSETAAAISAAAALVSETAAAISAGESAVSAGESAISATAAETARNEVFSILDEVDIYSYPSGNALAERNTPIVTKEYFNNKIQRDGKLGAHDAHTIPSGTANSVFVDEDIIYIGTTGVIFWGKILDDGSFDSYGGYGSPPVEQIWANEKILVAACGFNGLYLYKRNKKGSLTGLAPIINGIEYSGVWGDERFVYAACKLGGIKVFMFDIETDTLVLVHTVGSGIANFNRIWGNGRYVLATGGTLGLFVFEVSSSGILTQVGSPDYQSGTYVDLHGNEEYIFVATTNRLRLYTIDLNGALTYIDEDNLTNSAIVSVWSNSTHVFALDDANGLRVFTVETGNTLLYKRGYDNLVIGKQVIGYGEYLATVSSVPNEMHLYAIEKAYEYDSVADSHLFDGKINMANLPTGTGGLVTGDIWNDSGTIKIVL